MSFVSSLHSAEHILRIRSHARVAQTGACPWGKAPEAEGISTLPKWGAGKASCRMAVATSRLAIGAAVEAAITEQALDLVAPGALPSGATASELARLYADAHLVAVWTSAHATYVASAQSGVEEPSAPSVFSVPNAASELDWSNLFSRRWCPHLCPNPAQPLLRVLMRSTNPGSRGWNNLLELALTESAALRIVVGNAVVIALTAMHPYLHPALRPPWWMRMRVGHVAQQLVGNADSCSAFVSSASATKEAVRRMLASSTAASPALHAAMARMNHPVGRLTTPPLALPARGMEGAMAAFVLAGVEMTRSSRPSYAVAVNDAFSKHTIRVSKDGESVAAPAVGWDQSWLGKGTASVHNKVSLVSVASDVWSTAFRTNFFVFWAHCMTHKLRSYRLDAVHHEAIHNLNACSRLALQLPTDKALAVQKLALLNPSSGILTIEEAALSIGINNVRGTSSNGGTKSVSDALEAISAAGAEAMAKLLVYAKVAWVHEEVLIVELGENTRAMQTSALFRRLGRTDADKATLHDLPIQATTLHACTECRRVANAFCTDGGFSSTPFNELGVSSSMLCSVCESASTQIRCAKRASASLRMTAQLQKDMETRLVENEAIDAAACLGILKKSPKADAASGELGVNARVGRDAKNALVQRASVLSCGEEPMLTIPIVGRAIRLWREWYALCSLCGAMMRVSPQNRFGGEICCMRCDAKMLGADPEVTAPDAAVHSRRCRFCGKVCPETDHAKWKTTKAPMDIAGTNATLPPPLREVTYCPSHWRSWLPSAHRTMATRIILSHLAHNAKPVFNTNASKKHKDVDLGFETSPQRKRRRRKSRVVK